MNAKLVQIKNEWPCSNSEHIIISKHVPLLCKYHTYTGKNWDINVQCTASSDCQKIIVYAVNVYNVEGYVYLSSHFYRCSVDL